MSVPARARFATAVALAAALAFSIAAMYPEWALGPLRSAVSQMRRPEQAAPVARAFLATCAAACVVLALWWRSLRAALAQAAGRIEAWTTGRFWAAVVAVLVSTRMLVALLPYEPTSDALWYHRAAASLAAGEGFIADGVPTAYRDPGYPWLLSIAYRVAGAHGGLAWIAGSLATCVLLAAIHRIAKQVYDSTSARIAVLLAAGYPALALLTGQTMSDLVFAAGVAALLAFTLRSQGRPLDAIAAGLGCGVLALVRSVGLGLFPVIAAMWWLRRTDSRCLLRNILVAWLACAVVVTPWMARNANALGRFTIDTNSGLNLWLGHHSVTAAEPSAALGEAEGDLALRNRAVEIIADHPMEALASMPRKVLAMYLLEADAVTALFQGERHAPDSVRHLLYAISQLAWMAVAVMSVIQLSSPCHQRPEARRLQLSGWLFPVYFTLVCAVFFGADRYRLPVLPWLLVEAGAALGAMRFSAISAEAGRSGRSVPRAS